MHFIQEETYKNFAVQLATMVDLHGQFKDMCVSNQDKYSDILADKVAQVVLLGTLSW